MASGTHCCLASWPATVPVFSSDLGDSSRPAVSTKSIACAVRQVVDDFLSTPALERLVHYCRASTVWTDFLYKGGYVGTSLTTGLG